jgi:hypothetical protein
MNRRAVIRIHPFDEKKNGDGITASSPPGAGELRQKCGNRARSPELHNPLIVLPKTRQPRTSRVFSCLHGALSNLSPDRKWFLDEIGDGPVLMKAFSKPGR